MPNKTKRIFLDLDGVLVDFIGGLSRALDISPIALQWDWYDAYGISFKDVDKVCGRDFWQHLPWTPDGRGILHTVELAPNADIYILTCPMPNNDSPSGKKDWVQKNLPDYSDNLIITPTSKSIFALGPHCLLIDDKPENCKAFAEAGGSTILVPRPWNVGADLPRDEALNHIKKELAEWILEGEVTHEKV